MTNAVSPSAGRGQEGLTARRGSEIETDKDSLTMVRVTLILLPI